MIAWHVVQGTLMITAFVAMMMLAIEYLNVLTGGAWFGKLTGNRWSQYVLCAFLGAIPGCLGAFAAVSLYAHKRITFGALVVTMIATSGDAAFVMLAMFPRTAVGMFGALAAIGIAAGWITDLTLGRQLSPKDSSCDFLTLHNEWEGAALPKGKLLEQWRHLSPTREILAVGMAVFVLLMIAHKFGLIQTSGILELGSGAHGNGHEHGHGEMGWAWYTLLGLIVFGLFIVSTVSDHFLDEHLWRHVLRNHVPRIFLWTLGALSAIAILDIFIDVEALVRGNVWLVLAAAVLIGIIPDSGPHLIFVSLYAAGSLPLSVLIASSIVQDGHGMVPLLAHSRRDFFAIKGVNIAVGLAVGAAMLAAGF